MDIDVFAKICVDTANDSKRNPRGYTAGTILYAMVEDISVDDAEWRISSLITCLAAVAKASGKSLEARFDAATKVDE